MGLHTTNIADAYSSGNRLFASWSKAPTQTTASGIWFDLSMSPGNPAAQYYFATPQFATALARSTDGGLNHGENKSGYTKYLHKFDIQSVSAIAPMTFEILDYLAFYPGLAMDVGVLPLTTNITIPRYSATDNIQMMVIEQNPYVGGATFQITYTNQNSVAGQLTPVIKCNSQVTTGTIVSSATATANASGRFIPLAYGDRGVAYPTQIEILSGDVGLLCIVLVKSLATVFIQENTQPCMFDLWNDFSVLPIIKDDAYLNMICCPTATIAGASIIGNIGTFWSAA